jgi:phage repressor protein C with HTH and peptisase S24 domain
MQLDPVRLRIMQLIQTGGKDMKSASIAIGKNPAYLQQFLFRGTPKSLSDDTRTALADHLGVDEEELEHNFSLPRAVRRRAPTTMPADPFVSIPEIDIRAAAGGGAINEDLPPVIGTWQLPRQLLERDLRANHCDVHMMEVRGDSMLPTLSDGDRILVDKSQKAPSPPGIFVLHDGAGLVVKRLELVAGERTRIRLHSDNALYTAYDCDVEEVHMVGRVLWAAKRL